MCARLIVNMALLCDILVTIRRHARIHLRSDLFLHDFITQILLRNLQHGIVVVEIVDAVVYAHNYHRHNPGKFERGEFAS